jgi:yecA family protein
MRMQAADYEQIQQVLRQAHSLSDAAEAHGTLAGCLCSTVAYRFEDWMLEILPEGAADTATTQLLFALFQSTSSDLGEAQMEFAPLLPDDEEAIETRAAALGAWCQGFLYGLGTSSLTDATLLPGDVGEVVRDLTEITHVAADSAESLESNEGAYAELVEFVRAGVQLLFDELEPMRREPNRPEGLLH